MAGLDSTANSSEKFLNDLRPPPLPRRQKSISVAARGRSSGNDDTVKGLIINHPRLYSRRIIFRRFYRKIQWTLDNGRKLWTIRKNVWNKCCAIPRGAYHTDIYFLLRRSGKAPGDLGNQDYIFEWKLHFCIPYSCNRQQNIFKTLLVFFAQTTIEILNDKIDMPAALALSNEHVSRSTSRWF